MIADDSKILWRCFLIAAVVEFVLLTAVGMHEHWLAHPQKTTGLDASQFIDAELFQIPQQAHLVEVKKVAAPKTKEAVISKRPNQGRPAPKNNPPPPDQNQTTSDGGPVAANHGPVAVLAPPPVIPSYLQDQEIHASVVIEFLVNAQGVAFPRLIGSSGSEELDAIAIEAVKKWQFRPAERNHNAVDSKVRLRINFQVQ